LKAAVASTWRGEGDFSRFYWGYLLLGTGEVFSFRVACLAGGLLLEGKG